MPLTDQRRKACPFFGTPRPGFGFPKVSEGFTRFRAKGCPGIREQSKPEERPGDRAEKADVDKPSVSEAPRMDHPKP